MDFCPTSNLEPELILLIMKTLEEILEEADFRLTSVAIQISDTVCFEITGTDHEFASSFFRKRISVFRQKRFQAGYRLLLLTGRRGGAVMKKNTSAKMIKKAIDSYPGGICFSALDGRVILVNEKMNKLMLELTGHTILNAKAAWEKLTNFANNGKAEKLTQSWLPKDTDNENGSTHQQLFFRFSDSSVWRFELRFLDSNTVQIEAAEITELYRLSEELYENTIRLQEMQKRQKALLDSIVEVNLNKEILAAKMHIHDELGHCLLATTKAITEDRLAENADTLREKLEQCHSGFFQYFYRVDGSRFLSAV